jgi:hypothetical protein
MRTLTALACCVAGLVAQLGGERAGADDKKPLAPPLPADLKVVRTIEVGYTPAGSLHFTPDGKHRRRRSPLLEPPHRQGHTRPVGAEVLRGRVRVR